MPELLGYIEFLCLVKNAQLIITDSGGIQEESKWLGVQCITIRDNTERPVTVYEGTNHLTGTDYSKVHAAAIEIPEGNIKEGKKPLYWHGMTASRIVSSFITNLN
jgi:UDP-N-acetylglucosamine 2-epimerase (non-hydrolysing)